MAPPIRLTLHCEEYDPVSGRIVFSAIDTTYGTRESRTETIELDSFASTRRVDGLFPLVLSQTQIGRAEPYGVATTFEEAERRLMSTIEQTAISTLGGSKRYLTNNIGVDIHSLLRKSSKPNLKFNS
ncbi:MAG: hypothetical protein AABX11_07315 [Nanoarchaeota archaeon]